MHNVGTGEVHEGMTHFHVTRRRPVTRGNRDRIPPSEISLRLVQLLRYRIEDFDYLERVDVNMERVCNYICPIPDRPFFEIAADHRLIIPFPLEFFVIHPEIPLLAREVHASSYSDFFLAN